VDYKQAGTGVLGTTKFDIPTVALAAISPAKDKINETDSNEIFSYYCNSYLVDERGVMRNVLAPEPTGGLLSDIGAYEFEGEMDGRVYVTMSGIPNNMARIGQSCSLTATLSLPGQPPTINADFVWWSSNPDVASIGGSTGNLYSLSLGDTIISVTETMYSTTVSVDLRVEKDMGFPKINQRVLKKAADFNDTVPGGGVQIYFGEYDPDDVAAPAFTNAYRNLFSPEPHMVEGIEDANDVSFRIGDKYNNTGAFKPSVGITMDTRQGGLLPLSFVFMLGLDEVEEILGRSVTNPVSTPDVQDIFRKTLGFVFVDADGNETTLIDGDGSAGVDVGDVPASALSHSMSGNNLRLQLNVMFADASPIAADVRGAGPRGAAMVGNYLVVADNNPDGTISGELWLLEGISHGGGEGDDGGGGCDTGAAVAAILLLVSAAAIHPIVRGSRNKK
jgi:hypothetical protein